MSHRKSNICAGPPPPPPNHMLDLIRRHLGNSQLWPHCQHAARIVLDHLGLMQLPASNLVLFFQRRPGSYCAKLTRIQFGFGCLKFWRNGSNPSTSWCARIIWPTFGYSFHAELDQMQIRSSMSYRKSNLCAQPSTHPKSCMSRSQTCSWGRLTDSWSWTQVKLSNNNTVVTP